MGQQGGGPRVERPGRTPGQSSVHRQDRRARPPRTPGRGPHPRRPGIRDALRTLTDGNGVDVVYDPVGGDLAQAAMRSMAWCGRFLVIGFASGDVPQFPGNYLLVKNISIVGVYWGAYRSREPQTVRDGFAELARWWEEGKLKPHVSQVFPLAEAPTALAMLENRQSTGCLVIDIDG